MIPTLSVNQYNIIQIRFKGGTSGMSIADIKLLPTTTVEYLPWS